MAVINAAKQLKSDPEACKKREELNKRIEETRRKLQSVGYRSNLKSSQSITDLSHVPEKDHWSAGNTALRHHTQGSQLNNIINPGINLLNLKTNIPSKNTNSVSLPNNLQLCGCFLQDFARNTSHTLCYPSYNNYTTSNVKIERPRRLKLPEKSVASKYKLHKSLPVSPVSEECRFVDFAQNQSEGPRRSFSYFIDLDRSEFEAANQLGSATSTEDSLRQVCSDIQKFSQQFSADYVPKKDEEEGNFSSDSLEDCSLATQQPKKLATAPRRCYSNNEIYEIYQDNNYEMFIPKSQTESFYLNQSNRTSRESILSDEYENNFDGRTKSHCASLESILSTESECRSAPLEVLFINHKHKRSSLTNSPIKIPHSQSSPTHLFISSPQQYNPTSDVSSTSLYCPESVEGPIKHSQSSPTHFINPENPAPKSPSFRVKKSNTSYEFQQKLLKFETGLVGQPDRNKKPVAFFVDTKPFINKTNNLSMRMEIPNLKSKNLQYKSKYCNVLNNKPDSCNLQSIFGENSGLHASAHVSTANSEITKNHSKENVVVKAKTLDNTKLDKHQERLLQTTSLDRHLVAKSLLWDSEKIAHKPPKAVRRHSSKNYSKNRGKKQQNNYSSDGKFNKNVVSFDRNPVKNTKMEEDVIEISYKEKNVEIECESSNNSNKNNEIILSDIYNSLDKLILDSSRAQQNTSQNYNFWKKTTLDMEHKNVWKKYDDFDKINMEKSLQNHQYISKSDLTKIQNSIENIKLLHLIQQKIQKINVLVDTYKQNISKGKVKILSKMYETLSKSQSGLNNFTEITLNKPLRLQNRNLSLPNFVERHLSAYLDNIPSDSTSQNVEKLPKNAVNTSVKIAKNKNIFLDEKMAIPRMSRQMYRPENKTKTREARKDFFKSEKCDFEGDFLLLCKRHDLLIGCYLCIPIVTTTTYNQILFLTTTKTLLFFMLHVCLGFQIYLCMFAIYCPT